MSRHRRNDVTIDPSCHISEQIHCDNVIFLFFKRLLLPWLESLL